MSGHSKWSTIKRKKGAADAKRGKIFTRIIKDITMSVKMGGADPEGNPRLRLAISNAKGANMPKDNIARAIAKGAVTGGADYQSVRYEGYGVGGVAVLIEASTDNINRTVSNVRSYFTKVGGSLGTTGSLEFMFDHRGVFELPIGAHAPDELTMELIDGGALDVEVEDDVMTVYTEFESFGDMQKKLEELKLEATSATIEWFPQTMTAVTDMDNAKKMMKLIDLLEEDDDVNDFYHNMELSEELAEALDN
jgi:YebC/PmpR family DNA-binding regulatory protein